MWLGNSRGNSFSKSHKYLDSKTDQEFWNFSFYEMGKYDTKAVFEYILEETQNQKIAYVGHSQGVTQMLSALWEDEDWYADKISIFIALAPATRMSKVDTEFLKRFCKSKTVDKIDDKFNLPVYVEPNRFTINSWLLLSKVVPTLAQLDTRPYEGSRPDVNDLTSAQIFWHYHPNGTSTKALRHWRQIIKAK